MENFSLRRIKSSWNKINHKKEKPKLKIKQIINNNNNKSRL